MMSNKELIQLFEQRRNLLVENQPMKDKDGSFTTISEMNRHYALADRISRTNGIIKELKEDHQEPCNQYAIIQNNDRRSLGDDHSEVSKVPVFRGCKACCNAIKIIKTEEKKALGLRTQSFSIEEWEEKYKLNKKIVIHKERSLKESFDSDEMRINSDYLN